MNNLKNRTEELFRSLGSLIPQKEKRFTRLSMLIAAAINEGLKKNGGKTQKWLADRLGRKESQISKWLSGDHNFTIKTIVEIEDAVGTEILQINYIRFKQKASCLSNVYHIHEKPVSYGVNINSFQQFVLPQDNSFIQKVQQG